MHSLSFNAPSGQCWPVLMASLDSVRHKGATLVVLLMCGCSAIEPLLARRHQGHLASADHPGLHACFHDHAGVAAGVEFDVVRVSRIGSSPPRVTPAKFTTIGKVRVARMESDRCAEVEVMAGSPRVDDHLYRISNDVQ